MRTDALDGRIQFFPLTISSHRISELFSIMPGDGSAATYEQETTTPYFYSTRFRGSGIVTEFTATERCGYFRFTFPTGKASLVLADRIAGTLSLNNGNSVDGEEFFDGMKAYVYGEFSAPVFATSSVHENKQRLVISGSAKELEFRYGISFISMEQARNNLKREIPSPVFSVVKEAAKAKWNDTLGRIGSRGRH